MSDELILNAKKKNKCQKVISGFDEIDNIILPSSIQVKEPEKKVKKKKEFVDDTSEWLDELMTFTAPKPKKKKGKTFKGFIDSNEKSVAKKKKGKKDGELKDYYKEFEPELALLRSLYAQQSKFTDNLQKKYDAMEGAKSTARGVGKFTTDLITAINVARSTTLQIVDKTISTKEKIANLTVKERKEFGSKTNSEHENNAAFASTYLQQMINAGRNNVLNGGYVQPENSAPVDYSDISGEELFSSLEDSMGENTRDSSVDAFLKYENSNVEVCVVRDADGEWEFIALDQDGKSVDDYPLPFKCKMSFNPSIGRAISEFGEKYRLIENY